MNLESLVGQTLDGKYKIERELGRGGMGAVYLSTHVGTERPVAVKVIVPQFMRRPEFVERFRREARAAGRLRHPNVVDVTDFGFADMAEGRVAYLVMEYLDGCTLGEILEEEKQLPLPWTLDIIEQVSSAIHEAHNQGIIHRDLKPDNIWLEPNQRGGYTVKVLDFGIAKLETTAAAAVAEHYTDPAGAPASSSAATDPQTTQALRQNLTVSDESQSQTIPESASSTLVGEGQTIAETSRSKTLFSEAGTLIKPATAAAAADLEAGTAILPAAAADSVPFKPSSEAGTRLISEQIETGRGGAALEKSKTSELTRVGAVLGTPLYMSPEQCRGEKLDARSDIYSLAVIAYQMLSGKTPFAGDFTQVMQSHKEITPPPFEAKKVPKKVKHVIMSALAKSAEERPQSALTFANQLRSHSEGVGKLLQKSLVIYSEHLPTFLWVSFLLSLPVILLTLSHVVVQYLSLAEILPAPVGRLLEFVHFALIFFVGIWFGSALIGVTTWMVAQLLAVPLRPVSWRTALAKVKTKWRVIARTVTTTTLISIAGFVLCLVPGLILSVRYGLVSPVIMMEDLKGKAAIRRSVELTRRSYWTAFATMLIYLILPVFLSGVTARIAGSSVRMNETSQSGNVIKINEPKSGPSDDASAQKPSGPEPDLGKVQFPGEGARKEVTEAVNKAKEASQERKMAQRIGETISKTLTEVLWLPISVLLSSFSSITFALLYLKTRQAGGESMSDLLANFEEDDHEKSNWQKHVRERLMQSGRITSKGSGGESRATPSR